MKLQKGRWVSIDVSRVDITTNQWNDYTTHSKEDKEKMIEILMRVQEESQNIGMLLKTFWENLHL